MRNIPTDCAQGKAKRTPIEKFVRKNKPKSALRERDDDIAPFVQVGTALRDALGKMGRDE